MKPSQRPLMLMKIKAMLDPRSYIGLSVELAEKEAKRGLAISKEIKQSYK